MERRAVLLCAAAGTLMLLDLSVSLPTLCADTIYLKNGRQITGMIKRENDSRVELDIGFGVVGFKPSEIEKIYRSSPAETETIHARWKTQKEESEERAREAQKQRPKERRKDPYRREEPREISVSKGVSGHIVVEALINDRAQVSLMLDTGASLVILTKAAATRMGINPERAAKEDQRTVQLITADGRKVEAQFVKLTSVSVQGNTAKDVEAAVLTEDVDVPMKDGLLGMSFLKHFNVSIDTKNLTLKLERL